MIDMGLITDLLQNGSFQDAATMIASIWAVLLTLFKTPVGKKVFKLGAEVVKEELGITAIGDKIDSLDSFTRRHLENGDSTPMVERLKAHNKEQQELKQQITELQDYVTAQPR